MAEHVRKQVRQALVTLLTGLSSLGNNVFEGQFTATLEDKLPAVNVYGGNEDISIASLGRGHVRERTLTVTVELLAKAAANVDDTIDGCVLDIENAIDGDPTLGGIAKYVEPKHYERQDSGEGDTPIVSLKMNFEVLYFAAQSAPDVAM